MSPAYRLRVFGRPALFNGSGEEISLRTRKQYGLLLYLVLEGRAGGVPRERLIDLLWPGAANGRGRHSLSQALTEIRGRLQGDPFSRGSGPLRLTAQIHTELDGLGAGDAPPAFEEPLAGVDGVAGTDFDHWVDGARARCAREAREGLRDAMAACRREGRLDGAWPLADALYALDPLSDVAVHALAERALVRGDVVGAIQLLREHVSRLEETLGCSPQPDVERLLRRLESGVHPPIETVPPRLAKQAKRIRPPVFVGRAAELAALEAEWERARAGELRTCLIVGPGGIGKTSLLQRFATGLAARGVPVFSVACQEIGAGIPFALVADLLTVLTEDPGSIQTDPRWLAEASRVCPNIPHIYPGVPEPPVMPPEAIKLRLAEALLAVVEAVADERSTVILIDDIQHLDPASRDVLYLLTRSRAQRLLMVTVGMDDAPSANRRSSTHAEWITGPRIELGPLSRESANELVHLLSRNVGVVKQDEVGRLLTLGGGNPQFVTALIADWERHAVTGNSVLAATEEPYDATWHPPADLRELIGRRLRGLSKDATTVLNVLAIMARDATVPQVKRISGLDLDRLDKAAFELVEADVVRFTAGRLSMRNELERAVVYYAMQPSVREYCHARVAEWLLEGASNRPLRRLQASRHFFRSGSQQRAADVAAEAVPAAIAQGAAEEVEQIATWAIHRSTPGTRRRLQLVLASAYIARSQYQDGLRNLSELAPNELDLVDRARWHGLSVKARYELGLGSPSTLEQEARLAVELAVSAGDDLLTLSALQTAAEIAAEEWNPRMQQAAVTFSRKFIQSSDNEAIRALARTTLGYCEMLSGQPKEASEQFDRAASRLRSLGLRIPLRRALNGLGLSESWRGHFKQAERRFVQLLSEVAPDGDAWAVIAWSNLASLYHDFGWMDNADLCLTQAQASSNWNEGVHERLFWVSDAFTRSIERKDWDRCNELLRTADRLLAIRGTSRDRGDMLLLRADYCLAQGRFEEAWRIVEKVTGQVGSRRYPLGEAARHERLERHYIMVTEGPDVYRKFVDSRQPYARKLRLADRIELDLIDRSLSDSGDLPPCLPADSVQRMSGVAFKLRSLGYALPEDIPARLVPLTEPPAELPELIQDHGEPTVHLGM